MKIVKFEENCYAIRKFNIFTMKHYFLSRELINRNDKVNVWYSKEYVGYCKMCRDELIIRWNQRHWTKLSMWYRSWKQHNQELKEINIGTPVTKEEFKDVKIEFSFKTFMNKLSGREK